MPRCFMIQPLDGKQYDKRYEDVFEPAIRDAGLEPYRVDRDLSTLAKIISHSWMDAMCSSTSAAKWVV